MSEQPPTGPGEPDDLGSVAEEAAKLFGALQDWAKDQSGEWATGVSGLADIATKLEAVPEIAVVRLAEQDIVRHPLVASMIGVL